MKTTTLYDFTLIAGGSQVILADANMYKVLTATGNISVTRDGGATIKPLRAGRGERNVAFQRLMIKDLSGAPNSGTILVGDSDFIDDTIVLSSAINVRPEVGTSFYSDISALTALTPIQIFSAAANTGGAMVLDALSAYFDASGSSQVTDAFLAKATAPASLVDGEIVGIASLKVFATPNYGYSCDMNQQKMIAAGKGLYYMPASARGVNTTLRSCRYKLL